MDSNKLFFFIYGMIIFQLYLGITQNKTKSIFGACTHEVKNLKLNLKNNMFVNYLKTLYYKKIGHIIQGCLLGIILLYNIDISKYFDNIFDNSQIVCKNNFTKNIIITILAIVLLTLWQLNKIPFILPFVTLMYLVKIIVNTCNQLQFNIILLLLSCGYLIYNLGKRGYYYKNFIESSYFSNLFDYFVGMTIAIISYFIINKGNIGSLPISNRYMYLILLIFVVNTFAVIELIQHSKKTFTKSKSITDIQKQCRINNIK